MEYKQKYVQLTNFGYVSNDFKEAYRWLTADLLYMFNPPVEFSDNLKSFTFMLDSFFLKFLKVAGEVLFKYHNPDIPLILDYLPTHRGMGAMRIPRLANEYKFGMLDLVEYHSDKLDREFIVNEHFDPGLISLSLPSTEPGLELFDKPRNEWVKIPINKGALWCGLASSYSGLNYNFVPGRHRVTKNTSGKRLAMWYEVCCKDQISKDYVMMKKDVKIALDVYTEKVTKFPIIVRDGMQDTVIMVDGEMRIDKVKSFLENTMGLQYSKVRLESKKITMKNHKKVKEFNLQRDSVILLNPIRKEKPIKEKKFNPCQCALI